jgi:hypothetical protein
LHCQIQNDAMRMMNLQWTEETNAQRETQTDVAVKCVCAGIGGRDSETQREGLMEEGNEIEELFIGAQMWVSNGD